MRVRVGGDVALLKGVMKELLALEDERRARSSTTPSSPSTPRGFESFAKALDAMPFEALVAESGIARARDARARRALRGEPSA